MGHPDAHTPPAPPAAAARLFADRLPAACRFVELLVGPGVTRGLIGPREAPRIWERHVLNCAVVGELVPAESRVLDVGSGAGLPGIAMLLARPDLQVVLLEPMARRVAFLNEVIAELGLPAEVHRGRTEEPAVRRRWGGTDIVAARAVAPLGRLAAGTLPLLRPGGLLLAIKGQTAEAELARDRGTVRAAGGRARLTRCGVGVVEPPTTVIRVERLVSVAGRRTGPRRGRRRR